MDKGEFKRPQWLDKNGKYTVPEINKSDEEIIFELSEVRKLVVNHLTQGEKNEYVRKDK